MWAWMWKEVCGAATGADDDSWGADPRRAWGVDDDARPRACCRDGEATSMHDRWRVFRDGDR